MFRKNVAQILDICIYWYCLVLEPDEMCVCVCVCIDRYSISLVQFCFLTLGRFVSMVSAELSSSKKSRDSEMLSLSHKI